VTVPPNPTDWVLNGTIKYHFITDSVNAPVDWGLQFVRYPRLAIAASFAAITIEALVITSVFVRNEWYRLAMGAGAVALLTGFRLFMGLFWPGWWIQLLGFLPWHAIGRRAFADVSSTAASIRASAVSAVQLALVAFVIVQQVIVSTLRLERAPIFSWYDMYSGTYASAEAWNASRSPAYRIVAFTDTGRVELRECNPHGEFVREFEQALDGSAEARSSVWRALRGCGADIGTAKQVTLEGDVRDFDWSTLQFTTSRNAVTLGPLQADQSGAIDRP
jgi:hypothetical protein